MTKIYLYSTIFTASFILFSSSIVPSWSSPMIPKFNSTDDNPLGRRLTNTEKSFLTSIPGLSVPLGAIICGYVISNCGRKPLLLILGAITFLFYIMLALASNIWLLYISRFFLGAAAGGISVVFMIYCSELAEPKNRGTLMTTLKIFGNVGTLIALCFGPYMSYFKFHLIPIILSLIFFPFFYFFSVESPYYLINHDTKKTRQVLEKIRNFDEIDENMEIIKKNTQETVNNKSMLCNLKWSKVKKPFLSCVGFICFKQLTGIVIIGSYTQTIFEIAKGDSEGGIDPRLGPIILEIVSLIMNLLFSVIVDMFHRKRLLTISFLFVALCEIPFGLYFVLKSNGMDMSQLSLVPLLSLTILVISMAIGAEQIPNIYIDEVFPFEVKGIFIPILTVVTSIVSFSLNFSFTFLTDLIGMGYLFFIFSIISFIAPIYVKFCILETKGKSLQQIQDDFQS